MHDVEHSFWPKDDEPASCRTAFVLGAGLAAFVGMLWVVFGL